MNAYSFYLGMLAGIKTPDLAGGFNVRENHEVYYDYCELRNRAKDLLSNLKDTKAREKLSRLVKKLKLEEASLPN